MPIDAKKNFQFYASREITKIPLFRNVVILFPMQEKEIEISSLSFVIYLLDIFGADKNDDSTTYRSLTLGRN